MAPEDGSEDAGGINEWRPPGLGTQKDRHGAVTVLVESVKPGVIQSG
jgi:hypothetical protein